VVGLAGPDGRACGLVSGSMLTSNEGDRNRHRGWHGLRWGTDGAGASRAPPDRRSPPRSRVSSPPL